MGHFVPKENTYRIDLGDGEWVDVKREWDSDDWVKFEDLIGGFASADGQIRTGLFRSAVAIATVGIEDWHLLNGKGESVPFSQENVGRLKRSTLTKIGAEINRLNPVETEAEQKKSSPASTRRSRRAKATRKS